jgi:hypothetical protein
MTSGGPQAMSAIVLMQQRLTQRKIDVTFEENYLANDFPSQEHHRGALESSCTTEPGGTAANVGEQQAEGVSMRQEQPGVSYDSMLGWNLELMAMLPVGGQIHLSIR